MPDIDAAQMGLATAQHSGPKFQLGARGICPLSGAVGATTSSRKASRHAGGCLTCTAGELKAGDSQGS